MSPYHPKMPCLPPQCLFCLTAAENVGVGVGVGVTACTNKKCENGVLVLA